MGEIELATRTALDAVHRITDRMLEPATARAVLLGVAGRMVRVQ